MQLNRRSFLKLTAAVPLIPKVGFALTEEAATGTAGIEVFVNYDHRWLADLFRMKIRTNKGAWEYARLVEDFDEVMEIDRLRKFYVDDAVNAFNRLKDMPYMVNAFEVEYAINKERLERKYVNTGTITRV